MKVDQRQAIATLTKAQLRDGTITYENPYENDDPEDADRVDDR